MSKRLYPSVSEKRKKAAHQKKLIEKLPKLESYLTKGETFINSHQLTNVPSDESCRPQIAVNSKSSYSKLTSINLGKEIESLESDNADCDRPYGEKATTSLTSPTTIIVSVEPQQFSDPKHILHNLADYFHENLTETNREMMICKGPA